MPILDSSNHRWEATADGAEMQRRLAALIPSTFPANPDMDGRIRRIHERYGAFIRTSPAPCYAPGLALTPEIHHAIETYLPMAEIRPALKKLFSLAITSVTPLAGTIVETAPSWYAILHHLNRAGLNVSVDPSLLLHMALTDYWFRKNLLFALLLPRHYGGSFDRYRRQMTYLLNRLQPHPAHIPLTCLDAACGTGEQAWDLASGLSQSGKRYLVEGVSLNPLEIFSAAHGHFPGEQRREEVYREKMWRVLQNHDRGKIVFEAGDILEGIAADRYDVIMCNGLIGGPFIHDEMTIGKIVSILACGLKRHGILLAADRFHEGWKKIVPQQLIEKAFTGAGLAVVWREDGLAGEKVT